MATSLYTLADLQAAVYARLENNSICFQTYEVTGIINEALRATNILSGFYQGTLTAISQAGQLVYPTPAGMLYPQRVQFENTQLDPIPVTRIGQEYRTWTTDTTAKIGPVARWVPIGINYFCLHPADSLGGGTIFVTGVLETPLLVNTDDTMQLEDEYVTIVVEYCASRLPLKIGGANWAQASQLYTKSFQPAIKKLGAVQRFKVPRYFVLSGAPAAEGKIT